MKFEEKLRERAELINNTLEKMIVEKEVPQKNVYKAMRYSLMAGGKRLRPVLALSVCDMLGGNPDEVLPFGCAIEMIHTYSLIHDDLPCMDDDDYRRGRLTNHKVFGEAVAVLAGDALLNYAFEIMIKAVLKDARNRKAKLEAMNIIAGASGPSGMIGGQIIDLESENKKISPELLHEMHKHKTGALIKASVLSAAAICNASEPVMDSLGKFADNLGLAFQIKDDILDVEGNSELLGKNVGSDASKNKNTFVTVYGLEKSKEMLAYYTEQAIESLNTFGEKGGFLRELASYLLERVN